MSLRTDLDSALGRGADDGAKMGQRLGLFSGILVAPNADRVFKKPNKNRGQTKMAEGAGLEPASPMGVRF